MSHPLASTVTPFDFRSDFTAPAPQAPAPDRISISVAELAALLEDTRQSAAAMVRDEQADVRNAAIVQTTEQLKSALAQIVRLAELIEKIDFSESDKEEITTRICKIAAEIIDGQGNLFHS